MEQIAPFRPVYQAGTLSGNPLAMTAGLTTLQLLKDPSVYQELEDKSAMLEKGLREAAAKASIPVSFNRVGSMFSVFFTNQQVKDYATATSSDTKLFARYFEQMLKQGIYFAPSQFEAGFMSLAHTMEDIERTVEAAVKAFQSLS